LPDEKQPGSAAVRPFWSGTITFGLVSIPVDLVAAVGPRHKSMKLVDEEGHALGRRYWCPKDEKILDKDELVRGYETESGKMVVVTDEEFASAAPEKSRDIDLKRFVPLDEIPPFYFERPYFLAPDERAGKAYTLLAQTMARTGKAGIGSFVMRGHEYLVAILAENGLLRAEVLRYADELRTPEMIGLPKLGKPEASLVRALAKEIDALAKPGLAAAEMADLEAETLREFAQKKAKQGGAAVISMDELEDPDDDGAGSGEVIDLMQALRKSLGVKAEPAAAASDTPARKAPKKSAAKNDAVKPASATTAAAKPAGPKSAAKKTAAKTSTTNKASANTSAKAAAKKKARAA
jgi:DNA end-binding protein Ku